jgi:RNA polymerase Rpb1, domain 5/RNA polymerase Rpb1, domain 4
MKTYTYQNSLISKKQLRYLLAWSFTNYGSMQSCSLADELKSLGFHYASQAGISISLEDLKIPFVKNVMLEKANQEIQNSEKIFVKGKITDVERFQKIIDTWGLTSESLKNQIIYYFKNYDPLNSVYIMAFSGARGNLSQVRQLVGMRGLMSDPSGQIMNLPIKKNFREGLTITDYLMSGYGARKGIVDTALKTANSGYLTRRLIDVSQDILIREKDCFTNHSFLFSIKNFTNQTTSYNKILGRVLNTEIFDQRTAALVAQKNTQITPQLIKKFKEKQIKILSIRSPLTCLLYRAVCQECYGWDLANENLVDIGEAIGILAGQSIGEPGTQLTMRTFHTGGIFTSEAREQIISPINGIIEFYKDLKTVILRTNRGEDVLLTKNSGSLLLIPEEKSKNLIQISILRNTILFPKNNQYIRKDTVIGELINSNKQVKTEIKTILSDTSGEIFIPNLKHKINSLNNNKLIWILAGQLYNSPKNSFLNFYPDYKLHQSSYVFRTKLINHSHGFIIFRNQKHNLYQSLIKIKTNKSSFNNSKLEAFDSSRTTKNHLLRLDNLKYCITVHKNRYRKCLQLTRNEKLGNLLTNSFLTRTGGIVYYDHKALKKIDKAKRIECESKITLIGELEEIPYRISQIIRVLKLIDKTIRKIKKKLFDLRSNLKRKKLSAKLEEEKEKRGKTREMLEKERALGKKLLSLIKLFSFNKRTIIWLAEETHTVECEENLLFVQSGDFISKNFEFIPAYFSRTAGVIKVTEKNNSTRFISIKSGVVYKGKRLKHIDRHLYYPGETIFSNIRIHDLSLCEYIDIGGKTNDQLLVRSLQLYEFPYPVKKLRSLKDETDSHVTFKFEPISLSNYKSNQQINGRDNFDLVSNLLLFKINKSFNQNLNIELSNNKNSVDLKILETLRLNNYLAPNLRYKKIQPCFLTQSTQFISSYHVLGYLETVNPYSLEIVKIKTKQRDHKQVFLISNHDCISVNKNELPSKQVGDLIMSKSNLKKTGKIIIENNNFFTIQKGQPYFFPNCKHDNLGSEMNLQYRVFPKFNDQLNCMSHRKIFLSYYNLKRLSLNPIFNSKDLLNSEGYLKFEFSKLFLKNTGKLYSCLLPQLFKKFSVVEKEFDLGLKSILDPNPSKLEFPIKKKHQFTRRILLQSSELISNTNRNISSTSYKQQLTLLKFTEQKLKKSRKAVGLYSITEDYFEQEVNSLFCKNTEFIDSGQPIGLLNLEKEITGDIVQGLPRIEEILEARKKNRMFKRIPTSQKKGLLAQKTSLDINFEFKKVGTSLRENDKINPHKLVKVYFNYYGLLKFFLCDRTKTFKYARLIENYEASYKSFKKVQLFILNSVQSVYKSQGVEINDKHLEVIIKQMTTKVLITYSADAPLLRQEVIDLYHIQYINKILKIEKKQTACYIPLLLGITKAALNNPSFISAASFQETTRILTKAAIEGRVDWLRGLKENIIIGHLIPAGTGSQNYRNSFKKPFSKQKAIGIMDHKMLEFAQNPRQFN